MTVRLLLLLILILQASSKKFGDHVGDQYGKLKDELISHHQEIIRCLYQNSGVIDDDLRSYITALEKTDFLGIGINGFKLWLYRRPLMEKCVGKKKNFNFREVKDISLCIDAYSSTCADCCQNLYITLHSQIPKNLFDFLDRFTPSLQPELRKCITNYLLASQQKS